MTVSKIFADMRDRLNIYYAKLAKESLQNDFDKDTLFNATLSRTFAGNEIRKRVRIKHLIQ